jgi:signal transduction histidine kinase
MPSDNASVTLKDRYSPIAVSAVSFSLCSHAVAIALYRSWLWDLSYFGAFRGIIFFLVAFSALLSVTAFLAYKPLHMYSAMVLRAAAVLVFVYSFGTNLFVGLCLVIGLIFEVSVYVIFPINALLDVIILAATVLLHRAGATTFGGANPRFEPDVVIAVLCLVAISVTSILAKQYSARLKRSQTEVGRLDSAVAELSQTQFGFMRMATTARERSILEERNRITREIHDTIGYTLTNISMMLEAAQDLAAKDSARLPDTLRNARSQAQQGLVETRRALHLLREKEESGPIGLPAIKRMVDAFSGASGIHVEVEYGNLPLTSGDEIDTAIFHFIQEGLTNALRHGDAFAIRISLWIQNADYHALVRDNGSGAKTLKEGIGMMGMRERLGKLGGMFTARNVADGFEIRARIPKPAGE